MAFAVPPALLPRLPTVRNCDYRRMLAPETVTNLSEDQVHGWQQDVAAKARYVVLGETTAETVTTDLLMSIRPRLDSDCVKVGPPL
jgi:hypothetical protein